jgi:anaphase-promoting complex subunit 5
MNRYLTPSKVALLCLVTVYAQGAVPSSGVISVLSFLVSHIIPQDQSNRSSTPIHLSSDSHNDGIHTISLRAFEHATSSLPSSIPGRTIWDLLLKRLWHLDCFDALEEFFTALGTILVKSREDQLRDRALGITEDLEEQPIGQVMRFARQSPLGTFVRRARMEYMKCQFDDSVALWRAFIQYRMPTYHVWAKRNPVESGQINIDANLVDLGLEMNSALAKAVYGEYSASEEVKTGRSTKDVEMLLEFQVSEMQSEFAF